MPPIRPRFRPSVEKLEDRTTPAGVVTAAVIGGTLIIDGDDSANSVVVSSTGQRSVHVGSADADTSLNGLAPGEGMFLGGITQGIIIRTNGGDDTVRLEGLRQKRNVGVFTGTGNDTVQVVGSDLRSMFEVNTGAGDDIIETTTSRIRGKTLFNGGLGTDGLAMDGSRFDRSVGYQQFEGVVNGPLPVPPVPPVSVPEPDTTAPTVTVRSTAGESTAAAIVPFTVKFDEVVNGFELNDLGITNGTASAFTAVSGSEYTFGVTPTSDGTITISLPGNVATDPAGNGNTSATEFSVKSIRTDDGMTNTVPGSTDQNFVPTGSGLKVWDIQTGSGTAATAGSTEDVFYTGWLLDGTVFDSSRTTGSPANFDLKTLIAGFREGTVGMTPGGIRRLLIPPELGYGAGGSPPSIPGNSTLIFEVKLVAVS